jgi:hypothetical protein
MRDVSTLDDAALLELWDAAIGCDPWQREDLLVATATGGVAPRTPGARNVALLRWRQRLLGRSLPLRANCARCASELDLTLDIEVLCDVPASAATEATLRLDGRTVRLRPPTVDDLRELSARHADVDALADALLHRCAAGDAPSADPPFDTSLAPAQRDAMVGRLEALDPCARLDIALACPDCGHAWTTPLDVAATLWAELRWRAERLLVEVASLAREYGWSEREVLRISPARRAAYLQLAGAA